MAKIFKDLLDKDAAVIMNVTEFAEYLELNGVILACQFCPSTAKASKAKSDNYLGLYGDNATLYFKTADYVKSRRPLPKQGDYVYLGLKGVKKRFEVMSVEDELGVTCLILRSYRQNTIDPRRVAMAKAGLI